jgi:hypothetical protein
MKRSLQIPTTAQRRVGRDLASLAVAKPVALCGLPSDRLAPHPDNCTSQCGVQTANGP